MYFRITPITRNLLVLNIGIAIIQALTSTYNGYMAASPILQEGALYPFASDNFYPYQLLTHMFIHVDFNHLLMNMFAVFMFGPMLESAIGERRFLILYMISGVGASIFFATVQYFEINYYLSGVNEESIKLVFNNMLGMVGASGAVFGILAACGLLFPNTRIMLLFPPIPLRMKYFVLIYGAIELAAGLSRAKGDTVAHFAHIGGMIVAFIIIQIWKRKARRG